MKKHLLVAFATLGFATSAFAAEGGNWVNNIYAGGGLESVGFAKPDTSSTASTKSGNAVGFSVFGGYQFLPWIAAEVGYHTLGEFKPFDGSDEKASASTVELSAVFTTAPDAKSHGWLFRVGINQMMAKYKTPGSSACSNAIKCSNDSTNPTLGLGYRWALTDQAGLRVEYSNFGRAEYVKSGSSNGFLKGYIGALQLRGDWHF